MGRRNLIIIMLLITLGFRTKTLPGLNIENIDVTCGLMWIREKGQRQRTLLQPHSLRKIIHNYLHIKHFKKGLLFRTIHNKRISPITAIKAQAKNIIKKKGPPGIIYSLNCSDTSVRVSSNRWRMMSMVL